MRLSSGAQLEHEEARVMSLRQAFEELHRRTALFLAGKMSKEAVAEQCALVERMKHPNRKV